MVRFLNTFKLKKMINSDLYIFISIKEYRTTISRKLSLCSIKKGGKTITNRKIKIF